MPRGPVNGRFSLEAYLLEAAAWPLDAIRLRLLKALGRFARPLMRDRELRVGLALPLALTASFALTLLAPIALLGLGPIVLGIPHVLSDVRYLWVRPGHHRKPHLWLLIGAPLLALTISAHPTFGLLAIAAAGLGLRGKRWVRASLIALGVGLASLAAVQPDAATIVLAHAHNVVALLIFATWRPRRRFLHFLGLGLFALLSSLLMGGLFDSLLIASLDQTLAGVGVQDFARTLAPGADPLLALRLCALFAFAQSTHYALWIRFVPEEARERETPRTFSATFRKLRGELGIFFPLSALALAILIALSLWDLWLAQRLYLRAILFHGYLEFFAIGALVLKFGRAKSR